MTAQDKNSRPIAVYFPSFAGGGAERSLIRLINHWVATGLSVRLFVNQAKGPLIDQLDPRVPVTALGAKSSLRNVRRLAQSLAKDPPQSLYTALLSPNVAGSLAHLWVRARFPLISLIRNHLSAELAAQPRWRRILIKPLLRFAYARSTTIGCVASEIAEDLQSTFHLPSGKCQTTFNPVELATGQDQQPRPLYFPKTGPVVLSIGRLVTQKNYPCLLDSFARLRRQRACRLVILGTGPLEADLKAQARALGIAGDVTFAGFQTNADAALAHADLFLHTADFEGFPNVIAEALAAGCPVVATRSAGGAAEILDGGRFGDLAPPNDPQAIASLALTALDRPVDRPALRTRARRFSISEISARYLSLSRLTPEPTA